MYATYEDIKAKVKLREKKTNHLKNFLFINNECDKRLSLYYWFDYFFFHLCRHRQNDADIAAQTINEINEKIQWKQIAMERTKSGNMW